jgi:transposase
MEGNMATLQKRLTVKQQLWLDRLAQWEKSGLSQVAFCKKHQLVYGTFVYWRSHLRKLNSNCHTSNPVTFFPVTFKAEQDTPLVLQINQHYRIELRTGFNARLLAQVIQAVQQIA